MSARMEFSKRNSIGEKMKKSLLSAQQAKVEVIEDVLIALGKDLEATKNKIRETKKEEHSLGRVERLNFLNIHLEALQQVMEKLIVDQYVLCEDCEEPIGFERLKAKPASTRCVACQERMEKESPQKRKL